MKKIAPYFLCALLLGLLGGCGHRHDWTPADCEHPKLCAECGETEGEALGHDWLPADCTRPGRCARCDLTEGEALGHSPTEANYQDGSVCTRCGETLSAPLQPDFERCGLACDMVEGAEYEYRTCCGDRLKSPATGTVRVENYRIYASDETHPAREGYEWRSLDLVVTFRNQLVRDYGVTVGLCREDYYTIRLHDESGEQLKEDGSAMRTLCSFHGEELPEELYYESVWEPWRDGERVLNVRYDLLVPAEYDGAVLGVRDATREWGEGEYIYDVADESSLFFRLK